MKIIRFYVVGLYKNNSLDLWSSFFREDRSNLFNKGTSLVKADYCSFYSLGFRQGWWHFNYISCLFRLFLGCSQHLGTSQFKGDPPQLL